MKLHVFVITLLATPLLAACFFSSNERRIETGTRLGDGPVEFCIPRETPCQSGTPSGDGYAVASGNPDEGDVLLRFEPLTEVDGVPIYLGEGELTDGDETAWLYVVARPAGVTAEGTPQFALGMPGCDDSDSSADAPLEVPHQAGPPCTVTDLAAFRNYLITDYSDEFADLAWWSDDNQR